MKNNIATFKWPIITMPFLRQKAVLVLFIILPILASTQSNQDWTEVRMDSLYRVSNELYAQLPHRDYRGWYLFSQVGLDQNDAVRTWRPYVTCDGDGNIISNDTANHFRMMSQIRLGLSYRPINYLSVRIAGSFGFFQLPEGGKVVGAAGYSTLNQPFFLYQLNWHPQVLLHYKWAYIGGGYDFRSFNRGFGTDVTSILPQIDGDFLNHNQIKIHESKARPNYFVGVEAKYNIVDLALEVGKSERWFARISISMPLSQKSVKSRIAYQSSYSKYNKVRKAAVSIDRYLHPEKFQSTNDSSGGGDGGGGGGGCGG